MPSVTQGWVDNQDAGMRTVWEGFGHSFTLIAQDVGDCSEEPCLTQEETFVIYTVAPPPAPSNPLPHPPVPSMPPLSPMDKATQTYVAVPSIDVTFPINETTLNLISTTTIKNALAKLANCSTIPVCEVSTMHDGGTSRDVVTKSPPFTIAWISTIETPSSAVTARRRHLSMVNVPSAQSWAAQAAFASYLDKTPYEELESQLKDAGMSSTILFTARPAVRTHSLGMVLTMPPPPPPLPPPSFPPPSPPSPPAPPPGLCSNTCDDFRGMDPDRGKPGQCNDGGKGTLNAWTRSTTMQTNCPLGSDCNDCNVREYCIDCPNQCQALNVGQSNPDETCTSDMFGDGICDPQCNNHACDYNDCSAAQITAKCLVDMDNSGIDISTVPFASNLRKSDLYPVELSLSLNPARLLLNEDMNEMVLLQELDSYTLRWEDARIRKSACAGAVHSMLSMTKEDAKSDIARQSKRAYLNRFWIPQLQASSLVPGFDLWDDSTAFALGEHVSLSVATGYDPSLVSDFVSFTGEIEVQVLQNFE